jgi:hypothetical protein
MAGGGSASAPIAVAGKRPGEAWGVCVIRDGFAITHVTPAEARALAEQLQVAATAAEGKHASQARSRVEDFQVYLAEQERAGGVSALKMWADADVMRARCAEALAPFHAPRAGLLRRGGVVPAGSVRSYLAHLEQGCALQSEARRPVPWRRGVPIYRAAASIVQNGAKAVTRLAARAARCGAVLLQAWRT